MIFRALLLTLFLFSVSISNAQTCCSGGIPLSNNLGLSTIEKGTFQLGINYDYNNLNTLNFGKETLDDNSRLRITHSVLVNLNYDITNKLSIEGLFTWVNQRRKITQFGNENLEQSNGIGDAVLLLKYNLLNFLGKNTNLALGAGTKIPLGSTTETNNQDIILSADLQPGSNAWDLILWSQFSKSFNFRPSFNISTQITYRSTGTNNEYLENSTYKFGDVFQTFLTFSDQFNLLKTLANPSISFKYRHAEIDQIGGFDLENTGGKWVFLIPNFSINIKPNVAFFTKAELPLYSNVDGVQLTPTYRLTSGFLFKFPPKQQLININ